MRVSGFIGGKRYSAWRRRPTKEHFMTSYTLFFTFFGTRSAISPIGINLRSLTVVCDLIKWSIPPTFFLRIPLDVKSTYWTRKKSKAFPIIVRRRWIDAKIYILLILPQKSKSRVCASQTSIHDTVLHQLHCTIRVSIQLRRTIGGPQRFVRNCS